MQLLEPLYPCICLKQAPARRNTHERHVADGAVPTAVTPSRTCSTGWHGARSISDCGASNTASLRSSTATASSTTEPSRPSCALRASVRVHDPRFYSEIAFGGSIGAGEAYMLGYWTTDDLTGLMQILLRNRQVLDGMEGGIGAPDGAAAESAALGCAQHAHRQPAQYRRALRPRQRLLPAVSRPDDDVFERACSSAPDMTLAEASRREARPHLPQARSEADRSCARNRHRLGRLRAARGGALRLPRHHHDDLAQPVRARRASASTKPASATASRCCCEDYRDLTGTLRQAGVDRDDRGGRPSFLRYVFRAMQRPAEAGRRDAAAGDYDRRPAL